MTEENNKESNFMQEKDQTQDEKDQTQDEGILFLACSVQEPNSLDVWYLDSGCSNHMTGNRNAFATLDESLQSEVRMDEDNKLLVKGSGDILVHTKNGDIKHMANVFYVPGLKHNLLSVGQLLKKGYNIQFKKDLCEIKGINNAMVEGENDSK